MNVRDLHRYPGANGHVDTLVELPMEGEDRLRIEAAPGMMVTNGVIVEKVWDIPAADLENWYEIEAPEAPENPEAPELSGDEITGAEFLAMLEEVL